jgi:lipid-binding SYLF domain-containing protein
MRTRGFSRSIAAGVCVFLLGCLALPDLSHAASAQAIDESVNKILANFKEKHQGATEALQEAKGVLVFPQIIQAGFVVGGSYGEGALRIKGTSVAYYSIGSGSFGLMAGAQSKAVIILFMTQPPLTEFRRDARTDKSWQVGLNGDITAVNVGASGAITSAQLNRPIVSFTQDQTGLMVNLSLQGSKITRINR